MTNLKPYRLVLTNPSLTRQLSPSQHRLHHPNLHSLNLPQSFSPHLQNMSPLLPISGGTRCEIPSSYLTGRAIFLSSLRWAQLHLIIYGTKATITNIP